MASAVAAGLLAVPGIASADPSAGATDTPSATGSAPSPDPVSPDPRAMAAHDAAAAPGRSLTWQNAADVDNRREGRNSFRVSFRVENGTGERLTADNRATAHAACSGCRTVALAFQVGIFTGSEASVTADNTSVAVNETCDACVTFAGAQQFLLLTDHPLRITPDGQRRLAAVRAALHRLAASDATAEAIQQALPAAQAEVVDVLTRETRLAHRHGVLRSRQTVCDVHGRRRDHVQVQPID
ncbi:MAG TPA: hypothetical protein VI248_23340 [Kineosporiaceae bacterium]